ncbi:MULTISPECIES: YIP1 family protein [Paenibacillus]|uniref:YIP1 family protein n=1 Tax=Paenibacillus TaxID=44249 RepID=UPI002FDFBCC5
MKNLFTIFVAPEATFQRARESKTAWILPFVLLVVLSAVVIYLQLPAMEATMYESLRKTTQLDPSTYDAFIAGTKVTSLIMAPISAAASVFIIALLFMLLNLIVRGEAKFMQLVTAASFSVLPGLLGGLITGIMLMATGAQSTTAFSLSLAVFVTDKTSKLYYLLSLANPFVIWGLFLYVVGASVMMKRPRKKVGIWIVAAWLVFSLGSLLLV